MICSVLATLVLGQQPPVNNSASLTLGSCSISVSSANPDVIVSNCATERELALQSAVESLQQDFARIREQLSAVELAVYPSPPPFFPPPAPPSLPPPPLNPPTPHPPPAMPVATYPFMGNGICSRNAQGSSQNSNLYDRKQFYWPKGTQTAATMRSLAEIECEAPGPAAGYCRGYTIALNFDNSRDGLELYFDDTRDQNWLPSRLAPADSCSGCSCEGGGSGPNSCHWGQGNIYGATGPILGAQGEVPHPVYPDRWFCYARSGCTGPYAHSACVTNCGCTTTEGCGSSYLCTPA